MQNVIIKGKDNPVVLNFSFTGDFASGGLSNFDDIEVYIGSESYTLVLDPQNVVVEADSQLRILIGDTTSLDAGFYEIKVVGINGVYNDGYVLTECKNLQKVQVKDF